MNVGDIVILRLDRHGHDRDGYTYGDGLKAIVKYIYLDYVMVYVPDNKQYLTVWPHECQPVGERVQ